MDSPRLLPRRPQPSLKAHLSPAPSSSAPTWARSPHHLGASTPAGGASLPLGPASSEQLLDWGLAQHRLSNDCIAAARAGDETLVRQLLSAGADPNALSVDQCHTTLTAAVESGKISLVRLVLGNALVPCQVNARVKPVRKPDQNQTALMRVVFHAVTAVSRGESGLVEIQSATGEDASDGEPRAKARVRGSVVMRTIPGAEGGRAHGDDKVRPNAVAVTSPPPRPASMATASETSNPALERLRKLASSTAPARNPVVQQRPGLKWRRMLLTLLEAGADRYLRDGEGRQAVDLVQYYHQQLEELLHPGGILCGGGIDDEVENLQNILRADPGKISLVDAVFAGERSLVYGLLQQGCDCNDVNPKGGHGGVTGGVTPLIVASYTSRVDIVDLLIHHSGSGEFFHTGGTCLDLDHRDDAGQTALMYAVGGRSAHAPRVADGAREHAGEQSQTAAEEENVVRPEVNSAAINASVKIAITLLNGGADRYAKADDGSTALSWAKDKGWGHQRLVDVLATDPAKYAITDAAKDKDLKAVVALLEQGVDPNMPCPSKGYTPLIAAVFNRDVSLAAMLLSHPRTDANRAGRRGMSPLMYAAQVGDTPLVQLLLRHGAVRYHKNESGLTAYDMASDRSFSDSCMLLRYDPARVNICFVAAEGKLEAVVSLLRQGVQPNVTFQHRSDQGWHHELHTPLIAASTHRRTAVVQHLLKLPEVAVDLPNLLGQTALMYGAVSGCEELVLLLLMAGSDRYVKDQQGKTALDWANRRLKKINDEKKHKTSKGGTPSRPVPVPVPVAVPVSHAASARALGAAEGDGRTRPPPQAEARAQFQPTTRAHVRDLNVFSEGVVHLLRYDPARHSIQRVAADGDVDGIVALVKQGVDVNLWTPGIECETALIACTVSSELATLRLLLDHPQIKVDLADSASMPALLHAAVHGHEEAVLLLLRKGANRYVRAADGQTAVDLAVAGGHLQVAGVLSADPKRVRLQEVCRAGQLCVLEGLLKQRMDVNDLRADLASTASTPLIAASAAGQLATVRRLLEHPHVQVDKRNPRGETGLMHAAAGGYVQICRELMRAGADRAAVDASGVDVNAWAMRHSFGNFLAVAGASMWN